MSIKIPPREPRELVPEGNHVARVYQIIHIGTVPTTYEGRTSNVAKVRIGFELPEEMREFKEGEGMKPFVISREFTLSMGSKSNLRPFVEGIIGKLTDAEAANIQIEDLMGKTCLLNVQHGTSKSTGNEYAKVASASPLPKSMSAPEAINPPFLLDYDNFTQEAFAKLPDFLKEQMESSVEYKRRTNPDYQPPAAYPQEDYDTNDIPF